MGKCDVDGEVEGGIAGDLLLGAVGQNGAHRPVFKKRLEFEVVVGNLVDEIGAEERRGDSELSDETKMVSFSVIDEVCREGTLGRFWERSVQCQD